MRSDLYGVNTAAAASHPCPDPLPSLYHDDPIDSADISDPPRHGEAGGAGELGNDVRLPVSDLQNRAPTGSKQPRQIAQQTPHQIEAIAASIEGRLRVMTNLER